jgi:hypothetical protein
MGLWSTFPDSFNLGEFTMSNPQKCHLWATVCVALSFAGCGGRAAVPTSYNTFSDDQKMFKIDYPAGWSSESGGRINFSRAKFTSGNAEIEVQADPVTSVLLSQIATTGVMPINPNDIDSSSAARKAHWLEQSIIEEQLGSKEEKPVSAPSKLGNGLKSEFTGTYSFGGDFHGYRATTMNDDKRIRILCRCPADEWNSLKPAFDRAIASVDANPTGPSAAAPSPSTNPSTSNANPPPPPPPTSSNSPPPPPAPSNNPSPAPSDDSSDSP